MPKEVNNGKKSDEAVIIQEPSISKVFARETVNINVLETKAQIHDGDRRVAWTKVHNIADLQHVVIGARHQAARGTIMTIPQEYSWGRLQITEDAFNELMKTANISSAFLNMISAYGVKSHEDERAFYGFNDCEDLYWAGNPSAPLKKQCHKQHSREFCYNVPYMSRHFRSLDDPWSLRQSAAYVQQRENCDQFFCIILNPKDRFDRHVAASVEGDLSCCHLAFHTTFLEYLVGSWTEYIEYLSDRLRQHDNEAQYSNVEQAEKSAYAVSHHNLQDLHVLQAKIERAHHCVQSCINIGQHCQTRTNNEYRTDSAPNLTSCWKHSNSICAYITTMTHHATHLHRLHIRLLNIQRLLSSILVHRNSLLLQTSNHSSANTLAALLEITVQSRAQRDILTSCLGKAQADSMLLKALSMVATICLPASLIANIFSSNLIQSVPVSLSVASGANEKTGKEHLILSTQFWIYVAISVPLMVVTLLWMLFLDRRAHQKAEMAVLAYKKGESREKLERLKGD